MGRRYLSLLGSIFLFCSIVPSSSHASNDFEKQLIEVRKAQQFPDSVLAILNQMSWHAQEDSLKIEYLRTKGAAFFYKGLIDSSITCYSQAYVLLDSSVCDDQASVVNNGLAVVLHSANLKKEAIELYTKAMGCAEYRNDTALILKIYNNLSILNRELSNFERAEYFLNKAFALVPASDRGAYASLLNSKGQNFLLIKDYSSAMNSFKLSLDARDGDDLRGKASTLNNLGYTASLMGDLNLAMSYYDEVADIRERLGDLHGSASLFLNMADIAIEQKNIDYATSLVMNAELLNRQVNSLDILTRIYAKKADLEELKGNAVMALSYLREYLHLDDSLRATDLVKELSSAQYGVALVQAENKIRRIQDEESLRNATIKRQRWINLSLALIISVFIGLLALLLYQLKLLSNLRNTLTAERDQAEQKALSRRETLHAVVHELRTPMNAIISLADLIKRVDDINELRSMTDLLQKSSNRLLYITNNVLTYSRLEQGFVEVVRTRENISKLLEEVCQVLQPQAREKQLELTIDIEPNCYLEVDKSMVEIILMNLIGNALKYTKVGGVHVELHSRENSLVIEVKDTGIGISEAEIDKIFDPFYQSSDSSLGNIQGSGLGLSIASNYAKQLKGDLLVTSKLGEGSTFKLVLSREPLQ